MLHRVARVAKLADARDLKSILDGAQLNTSVVKRR
jgi:hypothetical protein